MVAKVKENLFWSFFIVILPATFVGCVNKSNSKVMKFQQVSKDEFGNMNTFLSNFTQVYLRSDFTDFDVNTTTPGQLIEFGIWCSYGKGQCDRCPVEDCEYGDIILDGKYVAESIKEYFDIDFKEHRSVTKDEYQSYHYDGKYYHLYSADGVGYPMARVKEVFENSSGQFRMIGEIYRNVFNGIDDIDEELEGMFETCVKPYKCDGKDTWAIVSFESKSY